MNDFINKLHSVLGLQFKEDTIHFHGSSLMATAFDDEGDKFEVRTYLPRGCASSGELFYDGEAEFQIDLKESLIGGNFACWPIENNSIEDWRRRDAIHGEVILDHRLFNNWREV